MEEDKSPDPVDIRIFCADGVMISTDRLAYLVEKFGGGSVHKEEILWYNSKKGDGG